MASPVGPISLLRLLSKGPLKPLLTLLKPDLAEEGFIVANNHPRGQALVNALQIRHLLGETELEAPASLVDSYPDALDFARPVREGLF